MIEVGNKVKIIDDGKIYSTYDKWIMGVPYEFASTLDLWKHNECPTKEDIERVWEVKYIAPHTSYQREFIALITDGQKAFAIGVDGLEVVHKVSKNHLTINNLNILAKEVYEIAVCGNIKTDTRSMLKYTATEVVEVMEAYKDYNDIESAQDKKGFGSELAGIICSCLVIARGENIDIENSIRDCVEKNRKRVEGIGDKLW